MTKKRRGNPQIRKYSYPKPRDRESYTEQVLIRLSLSQKQNLIRVPNWHDCLRDAINIIISEHEVPNDHDNILPDDQGDS